MNDFEHSIFVEFVRSGGYIPRRDTSSRVDTWGGGRLFPGAHHHTSFEVRESDTEFCVALADLYVGYTRQTLLRNDSGDFEGRQLDAEKVG